MFKAVEAVEAGLVHADTTTCTSRTGLGMRVHHNIFLVCSWYVHVPRYVDVPFLSVLLIKLIKLEAN